MDRRTRPRARGLLVLGGIALVALCALAVDLSGVRLGPAGGYTLGLWQPVTLRLGPDLGGGVRVLLRARRADGRVPDDRTMGKLRHIVFDRIDHGTDLAAPSVRAIGRGAGRYIAVEWAGSRADLPAVRDLLERTGAFSLVAIGAAPVGQPPVSKCGERPHPPAARDLTGESARGYLAIARGADLIPGSVAVGVDTLKGSPVVDAALTGAAAARVRDYVAAAHPLFLAVAMDDTIYDVRLSGHILPLGGQFQITGTTGSICVVSLAKTTADLVTTLTYGALPASLRVVDVREVGPSPRAAGAIGAASIIALSIIALVAARRSRPHDVPVVAALLVAALATLAVVKIVALTLTLAGLAGFGLAALVAADGQVAVVRGARAGAAPDAGEGDDARARRVARPAVAALGAGALLWWVGTLLPAGALVDVAAGLFIGVAVGAAAALMVTSALLRLSPVIGAGG